MRVMVSIGGVSGVELLQERERLSLVFRGKHGGQLRGQRGIVRESSRARRAAGLPRRGTSSVR